MAEGSRITDGGRWRGRDIFLGTKIHIKMQPLTILKYFFSQIRQSFVQHTDSLTAWLYSQIALHSTSKWSKVTFENASRVLVENCFLWYKSFCFVWGRKHHFSTGTDTPWLEAFRVKLEQRTNWTVAGYLGCGCRLVARWKRNNGFNQDYWLVLKCQNNP